MAVSQLFNSLAGNLIFTLFVFHSVAGSEAERTLIDEISQSGRVLVVADDPDSRVRVRQMLAPGPPPLLSFRIYEGKLHHRFGNSELMLDDAGH